MVNQIKYRQIKGINEEGPDFASVLQDISNFYKNIMNGESRNDSPTTLMTYGRDWEYPWVFIKSKIKPDCKILDCGSGYSPLLFIWAKSGADVYAIDKDAIICSKTAFAFHCFKLVALDIIKLPLIVLQKVKKGDFRSLLSHIHPANIFTRNWRLMKRIWKPDFWGPVSPKLLNQYGVDYKNGNMLNLPYENEYFDVVSCISVLEHMSFEDQKKGIREMSRVVKEGGKLIITYDQRDNRDLIDVFIKESGMNPSEITRFIKPNNLYDQNKPDVIGMCLIKP